jgi:hypothetical protein
MMGEAGADRWSELGVVRLAVAFTLLAGAVAVVLPFLNALVVALAAIALAGTARSGRSRSGRVRGPLARWGAGISVAAGGFLFVALPAPWSLVRGLVLGAALLPLAVSVSASRVGPLGGR